jgi:hypothetical protein
MKKNGGCTVFSRNTRAGTASAGAIAGASAAPLITAVLAAVLFTAAAGQLFADSRAEVTREARRYVGSGYCRGSAAPPCFDCSGFIYHLLRGDVEGLPRTSREMARFGTRIDRDELQPGDLLFFATTSAGGVVSHVALYLGQESIIHAISDGPNRGVHITPLNARYWRSHYHSAVQVLPAPSAAEAERPEQETAGTADQPIRFAKGAYTGELLDGQPHGTGRLEFDNGDLYRGEFAEGRFHGTGTYLWAHGARYEGEFRNGSMHGEGVYTASDGTRIAGTWRNGEFADEEEPKRKELEPRQTYNEVHDSPWDEWDGYIQGDFYAWQKEEEESFEKWKEQNSSY